MSMGLDAGYCYCYHTNYANPQAQLLLGQPGRCLQVLRSHPRRVSLVSFYHQFEGGNELAIRRDGCRAVMDGLGCLSLAGNMGYLV